MKPRTIVYGLGKRFQKYFYEIHGQYDVVGYCDTDPAKFNVFRNGMSKEELAAHPERYDQILVTLADRRKSLNVIAELSISYGIDLGKMVYYQIPSVSLSREAKDNIYHPEMIFYGNNNEDAVLWLLVREMCLDIKGLVYLETGLKDLRKGSVTYGLYRKGAKGILTVNEYVSLSDEAKIFRMKDRILYGCNALRKALDGEKRFDIVVLHDIENTRWLIDDGQLFVCAPKIILAKIVDQDTISHIRYRGYVWYSTLSASIAVFCRSKDYLFADSV